MTRLGLAILSGATGLLVCLAVVAVAQYFHLTPKFPSPGGEDDFSFRAGLFILGVCPAFTTLGVWIALRKGTTLASAMRMWGGAVVGSFVVFLLARLTGQQIEGLTADGAANVAVTALFVAWVLAAFAGAYVLRSSKRAGRLEL